MDKTITLTLTEDEAELICDALEEDQQGYVDSMKEARGNNNHADVKTFGEAAERIQSLINRVRALID